MNKDILKEVSIKGKYYNMGRNLKISMEKENNITILECSDRDISHFIFGNPSLGILYDIRDVIDNSIKSKYNDSIKFDPF